MKIKLKTYQQVNGFMLFIISAFYVSIGQATEEYQSIEWSLPSARFADLDVSPQLIAQIAQGGQIIISSKAQDFSFWNARSKQQQDFKNKRVIYAATVINAPADEIREMVWDLGSQKDYSPLLSKTKNISTQGDVRIGSYIQTIKLPIIKLASTFVVQHNRLDNGDIGMVLIDQGDIESYFQYWEFFPLADNKTLTVLSSWQDTDSASFMYKILLEAEPAAGKVFPILTLYERLERFKFEASQRHPENRDPIDDTVYDIRSINGFISDIENLDIKELKKLTLLGGVQFYQKSKKLAYGGKVEEIIQVSAIQYIPIPKKIIQPILNDFSSLVEYNILTDGYLPPEQTGEEWAHLQIAFSIGPIKIPVEIYPIFEDVTADRMLFHTSEHSYMNPLFGHIEYIDMPDENDQGTIVELSIGGMQGEDASFLFKMLRYVPFHEVLIAAAYAMLTVDGMGDWIVGRVARDQQELALDIASTPVL